MGLGKTLQTCALLSYMKEERGMTGPSLVVCPLSVLPSWMNELARWAPNLRVQRLHTGNKAQKMFLRKEVRVAAHAAVFNHGAVILCHLRLHGRQILIRAWYASHYGDVCRTMLVTN